ncbi:MAG: DNA mismatch repair protein MutS [Clostridia bacterium]|nr:DNA mismatch repair protein MutS [Clostridia bacterium]
MPLTPMMCQYLEVKEKYKDAILLYRLGDFYEMFFEDAKTVSRELELTLTGRDCGLEERAPMCGVPYHAAEGYIGRLVAKGYKVVVCEQMEDPATAKGLVKRDVTRIVTPGTVIDPNMLESTQNNYLASIYITPGEVGVCFADVSTGEASAAKFFGERAIERAVNELGTFAPREVLLNIDSADYPQLDEMLRGRLKSTVQQKQTDRFDLSHAGAALLKNIKKLPSELGMENTTLVCAVGALVDYIAENQRTDMTYIKSVKIYSEGQYLEMDVNTRRNLELTETMRTKEKKGTLLWVLDRTRTAMGARLLRRWVELPLLNIAEIERRQGAVEELYDNFMKREELGELLRGVLDVERLLSKVAYGSAVSRDLKAISQTAAQLPAIKELLSDSQCPELVDLYRTLDTLDDIRELIDSALVDEPPFSVREGGFIRKGYNEDVDKLRSIIENGDGYVREIEAKEREATGIKNLKVGYNRVFGYYIEVTKSNLGDVPLTYIRKQTLTNCERYITQELKSVEATILSASDKINVIEYELFCDLLKKVNEVSPRIQQSAANLALLDVYLSLADVAVRNNYIRPTVDYSDIIDIKEGRHPVVEQFVRDSYFVPNSACLDTTYNRMMLITGPNMAGKSTFMRQVALISVMAQIGSFVPAKEATIGIIDKLFTRVGASDDLASGQSTFMLEMNEVAYILKNATRRSLVIYDEIGRGTSTYDGMSIARAVAEYTAGKKLGAKTLFATHYHELTELEADGNGIVNYNIAAKKKGDDVTFLRRIVRGAADDSYGIEVAKLAGVPNEVIKRAKEILKSLVDGAQNTQTAPQKVNSVNEDINLTFDDLKDREVADKLRAVDADTLTPLEALSLIYELKKILK